MRRLGFIDILYLSLDSLKTQPSLIIPLFFAMGLSLFIFSHGVGSFQSLPEFLGKIPEFLGKNSNQLIVMSIISYLMTVSGASVICGMTKVGIATGNSSLVKGALEAGKHIFSIIVAFLIAGIISGILVVGGVIAISQVASGPGILAALLYAFVLLLGFMLGILFLYTLPAIVVDGLDSITAIGLSIGIVMNHLRESLFLALLVLVSLVFTYFGSFFFTGLLHFLFVLLMSSLVITVLIVAVTVDYVNLK